jgi:hypothetical protein
MKVLLSAAALFIAVLTTQAQEKETIYRSDLPSKARSFLTNFKSPLHHAVRATDENATTYGIVLNNKTEIKFADNGLWMLIDGKGNPVPYKFLDKPLIEYIKTNYANTTVTRIERCNAECKLALSNGDVFKYHLNGEGALIVASN